MQLTVAFTCTRWRVSHSSWGASKINRIMYHLTEGFFDLWSEKDPLPPFFMPDRRSSKFYSLPHFLSHLHPMKKNLTKINTYAKLFPHNPSASISHLTLGVLRQDFMISCQFSPVAIRNKRRRDMGNVWKLLYLLISESSDKRMLPKSCIPITAYMKNINNTETAGNREY